MDTGNKEPEGVTVVPRGRKNGGVSKLSDTPRVSKTKEKTYWSDTRRGEGLQ